MGVIPAKRRVGGRLKRPREAPSFENTMKSWEKLNLHDGSRDEIEQTEEQWDSEIGVTNCQSDDGRFNNGEITNLEQTDRSTNEIEQTDEQLDSESGVPNFQSDDGWINYEMIFLEQTELPSTSEFVIESVTPVRDVIDEQPIFDMAGTTSVHDVPSYMLESTTSEEMRLH